MAYHWTDALRRDRNSTAEPPQIDAAMDCPPCSARHASASQAGVYPTQQMGQTGFDDMQITQRG